MKHNTPDKHRTSMQQIPTIMYKLPSQVYILTICIYILLSAIALPFQHLAIGQVQELTEEQQADVDIWIATLEKAPGGPQTRDTAAKRLVDSGWPEVYTKLGGYLLQADKPEVIAAICRAIQENSQPPMQLQQPLLDALLSAPTGTIPILCGALTAYSAGEVIPLLNELINVEDRNMGERVALINSLGQFIEVEAVDALIPWLQTDKPQPLRQAAQKALENITGLTTNSDSLETWQVWWSQNRSSDREGLFTGSIRRFKERLTALQRQVSKLERDRETLLNELLASYERQYWLTASDARFRLLIEFLKHDSRVEVCLLGLRLVEKVISNGENVPENVTVAVAALINHPDSQVRATAIRRLGLIDDNRAADLIAPLLETETDTAVREAMISVLCQHPVNQTIPVLIGFINEGMDNSLIARALVTAYRADMAKIKTMNAAAEKVAAGYHDDISKISPDEVELLACSDIEAAQQIIERCLAGELGENTDHIEYAARGLAYSGFFSEQLYAAAGQPEVYPWVVQSLVNQGGLAALKTLLEIGSPDNAAKSEAISRIISTLIPDDWLAADDLLITRNYITLNDRIGWLARIGGIDDRVNNNNINPNNQNITNANGNSNGSENHTANTNGQVVDGLVKRAICLRLASLYLQVKNPVQALATLKSAPASDTDKELFTHLNAVSRIALGEFEQVNNNTSDNNAASSDNTMIVDYWIEALEIVLTGETVNLDLAGQIINRIDQQFGSPLPAEILQIKYSELVLLHQSLLAVATVEQENEVASAENDNVESSEDTTNNKGVDEPDKIETSGTDDGNGGGGG